MLAHYALVAAIALLWGRVLALQFTWPTWLTMTSLAAACATGLWQLGGDVPLLPTSSLAWLGIALLAERQLAAQAAGALPTRRAWLWWATLGGAAALAALATPAWAPIAIASVGFSAYHGRRAARVRRWGISTFVVVGALGGLWLGEALWRGWQPLVALPVPPTADALEALLDDFGALAVVLVPVGLVVATVQAPWATALAGLSLLALAPLPWASPWAASWPWAFAIIIAVTLAIGWLATRAERPRHRATLWLALTLATTAFAWVPARL